MFAKIVGFELLYQLKNPVFWVGVVIFFLLTFGLTTSDQISIGSNANVHVNSPFAMAQSSLAFSLFFMFISTAFVANVVVRDDETGFGPIIRATRIGKFDYLFGRFLGAFIAVALAFLAVPLATLIGSFMPWVDPEKVGPFVPVHYLYTYVVIALPSLFLTSAGFFALATATRSMMGTYVGLVGVLVTYFVVTALAAKPEYMNLMAYVDPMGMGAVDLVTRYWTVTEKNTTLIPLLGPFIYNRAIWTGIACALLAIAYAAFKFEVRGKKATKAEKLASQIAAPTATFAAFARAAPKFDGSTARAQLWARTRLDMAQVFKSPAFFVLLALGLFNAGAGMWFMDGGYGVDIYPVTRQMINVLRGAFAFIPVIVAIYYAGELVWRERDRGTEEIIDAAPVPDWVFVAPKILAIALVFVALIAVSIVAGLLVQTLKGYATFELGKYIWWYLTPLTVSLTLFAVLAVFVQALVPHKFIGWGVMVLYIVAQIVAVSYGLDHGLYRYGGGGLAGPMAPLSDMNGQGRAGEAGWWFRAYWGAIALVIAVLTYALWRRGKETRLTPRLRRLPSRLMGPAGALLALGVVATAGLGAFIFVNTNVWNVYHTSQDDERWTADYEKALLHYETLPQPKITDVRLNVALYPDHPKAVVSGVYVIENKTSAPIREIQVRFDHYLKVISLSVEGAWPNPKQAYERFNYRIFTFDTPMAPGDRRRLSFQTELGQKGFRNSGNLTSIVNNGTFINDQEIAPAIGMDRAGALTDRSKRHKYGLKPAELRMPKLEDDSARQFNLLRKDADWVNADITVSTVADQTPIAPGYKVSDVTADGRRTARFVTEAPINDFFSIQSGRYAIKHELYKGVDLSIYYDPHHPWNVDRMIAALKVGLDYDQANFSPYQFHQARILEFPAFQGAFAQSFANTVPYSEDIGFIFDSKDKSKIDMVTYVTAHELGHQWWAHQVIGARMQGVTMLDETLAQYSAIMAMEKLYGRDQIRKFLKYELDAYLRSRGGETIEEEPLERVEDQAYIHYRKGSLVMYRLKDVIGEDKVNAALRALLKQYAFKGAPYPKSTDLVALFRQEAGPDPFKQQLITDLFEKITVYDLRTVKAVSRKRPDGKFDVTLTLSAKKHYADGKGRETDAPMNEPVDIGLFAKEPGKKGFVAGDVILMQRMMIKSGAATVSFVADRAPAFAGVDPYNTMIDRNSDENIAKVGN